MTKTYISISNYPFNIPLLSGLRSTSCCKNRVLAEKVSLPTVPSNRQNIVIPLSGHQTGHRQDLPRARVLQEEGRGGAGVSVQRDEGLQHPRPGGGVLPGIGLHRGDTPDAG